SLKNTLELVGVDWKSVSLPATLPVHTDFFPDNASLKSETYVLHDYRVVVTGLPAHEWESTLDFVRDPGLLYCRRQLTVREVFYEMLLQRLSHGFQLCEKPPCLPTSSSSTGLDHHCASTVGSPGSTLLCTSGNGTAVSSLSPPGTTRQSANKSNPRLSLEQRGIRTFGNSNSSYFARKQLQQQQTSLDPSRSINRRKQSRNSPNLPISLLNANNPRGGQLTNTTVRIVGIGLIPSGPPRSNAPLSRSTNRSGPRTQSVTPPAHDKLLFPHKVSFIAFQKVTPCLQLSTSFLDLRISSEILETINSARLCTGYVFQLLARRESVQLDIVLYCCSPSRTSDPAHLQSTSG
ncbi:hypothetical protein P879_04399, partial [Paragonimus westermani]